MLWVRGPKTWSSTVRSAFLSGLWGKLFMYIFGKSLSCLLCFSCFFPWNQNCLVVLLMLNHHQPAVCRLAASTAERAGWIVKKFPDFLVPSWNSGLSIVEVTPTESHKHSFADCLPSQCWHWHFPSLSGGLIFMYFHCNYMAMFSYFQNALVFPHWCFPSTTPDQTELLPTHCFLEPLNIKPTSKQKIKHPNKSWRGSKINTMKRVVE